MAKGFLTGVIWGAVVSAVGAGALSVSSGRIEGVAPLSPPDPMSVTAPDAPEGGGAGDAPEARVASGDVRPEGDELKAPDMTGPDAAPDGAVADPPESDPATAPAMDVAALGDADASEAPQLEMTAADPAPASAAPDAPDGQADGMDAPLDAGDTVPPVQPAVGAPPVAPDGARPDTGAQVTATADAPGLTPAQGNAPDAPAPEGGPVLSTDTAQPAAPEDSVQAMAAPAAQATPGVAPAAETAPEAAPLPQATSAPEIEPVPQVGDAPEAAPQVAPRTDADPAPRLAQRAGSLVDRSPSAQNTRLPRIASAEPQPDAVDEPGAAEAAAPISGDTPLVRNAQIVDAAPDVPRISIVLIDDGAGPLGPEALEAFPFPVSFAIAPSHPAPARTAAAYRDLGFEVLVIAAVPEGAQPSDVEVALASVIDTVPQAVAVMESPEGGLQGSRAVSTQATEFLAASGHGLVMMPKGLNTAQKLALKSGVPSVSLFRDFDGEGQDAGTIRRTLDQALFRARQEGAVVMLGRLRADTISALVLWGLQDRSGTVALVPVSTVLRETVAQSE